jgi:SAM-dependent methyltransferase
VRVELAMPMREVNRAYYTALFEKYGEDVRTLWQNKQSQEVRFSVLCRIGDLAGARILDVGCGLGDFFAYLRDRSINLKDYLGLECVEEIRAAARKRNPSARFEGWDVLELQDSGQFDWVFGSGLFALKGPDGDDYALQMVKKMFSLATKGVGVNFLSAFTKRPDGFSNYCHPAEVLRTLAQEVSPIVELIHSYRANDFTVFLYHEYFKDGRR